MCLWYAHWLPRWWVEIKCNTEQVNSKLENSLEHWIITLVSVCYFWPVVQYSFWVTNEWVLPFAASGSTAGLVSGEATSGEAEPVSRAVKVSISTGKSRETHQLSTGWKQSVEARRTLRVTGLYNYALHKSSWSGIYTQTCCWQQESPNKHCTNNTNEPFNLGLCPIKGIFDWKRGWHMEHLSQAQHQTRRRPPRCLGGSLHPHACCAGQRSTSA